jgi:hypothetical protein
VVAAAKPKIKPMGVYWRGFQIGQNGQTLNGAAGQAPMRHAKKQKGAPAGSISGAAGEQVSRL